MGWCHPHMWQIKNGRDFLAVVSPWGTRVPSPTPDPQPRVPVLKGDVHITSRCKNQWRLWLSETKSFCSPRPFLLKGLHRLGLTASELQCWGSSLKRTRDTWGGTGLSGIRRRAGGVVFFHKEVLAESVPFLSPSPTESTSRHHI